MWASLRQIIPVVNLLCQVDFHTLDPKLQYAAANYTVLLDSRSASAATAYMSHKRVLIQPPKEHINLANKKAPLSDDNGAFVVVGAINSDCVQLLRFRVS